MDLTLNPGERYYLAYGSNMNSEQMDDRCPDARRLGPVTLEGYRLTFRLSGSGYYASIDAEAGSTVPCILWAITATCEARLDRYEGVANDLYVRKYPTLTVGARTLEPLAYILDPASHETGMPSETYVTKIRDAYRTFGLDEAVPDWALDGVRS